MNISRKHRLRALEIGTPDPDPLVSVVEQHILASELHRVYGRPGKPAPRLEDFKPRLRSEMDAEFEAALARAYAPKDQR